EGVPLAHKYLPSHENWPVPIKEHYGDWAELAGRDDYVEWTGKARPLEEAFSQDYQEGMVSVTRQFFEHFDKKKYTGSITNTRGLVKLLNGCFRRQS
ncbi:unnamed protein product, partial [marine sediment metagenome]